MSHEEMKRLDDECCGNGEAKPMRSRVERAKARLSQLPPPVNPDDDSWVEQMVGGDFGPADEPMTAEEVDALLKAVEGEASPSVEELEFAADLRLHNLYSDVVFQLGVAEGMRRSLRQVEEHLRRMMPLRRKENGNGDQQG